MTGNNHASSQLQQICCCKNQVKYLCGLLVLVLWVGMDDIYISLNNSFDRFLDTSIKQKNATKKGSSFSCRILKDNFVNYKNLQDRLLSSQNISNDSPILYMGLPTLATTHDSNQNEEYVFGCNDIMSASSKIQNDCFFPSTPLETIHEQHPNATIIIGRHHPSMDDWMSSVQNWNVRDGVSLADRWVDCDLPGLPKGFGKKKQELQEWHCNHNQNIREFVARYPSHLLLEIDLYQQEGIQWISNIMTSNKVSCIHKREKQASKKESQQEKIVLTPVRSSGTNIKGQKGVKSNTNVIMQLYELAWNCMDTTKKLIIDATKNIMDSKKIKFDDDFFKLFENHPQCLPSELDLDSKGTLKINQLAKYIQTDPIIDIPRYDHKSCFLMKARYNCAKPPGSNNTEGKATDWKMVLRDKTKVGKANRREAQHQGKKARKKPYCDLSRFIQEMDGPKGILKTGILSQLQNHKKRKHTRSSSSSSSSSPSPSSFSSSPIIYNILMQGDSYVRQVFEALTCGFQHQMTDLRVQKGGPSVTLDAIAARNGKKVEINETGTILTLQDKNDNIVQRGCHGGQLDNFYRPGVSIPTTVNGCNDNIAMVEFDHSIRFFYIFRPEMWQNTSHIYNLLGMESDGASYGFDALIWNYGANQIAGTTDNNKLPPLVQDFSTLKNKLKNIQKRDTPGGTYYGADNPWIIDPPDKHPCMPGIPDDEVNLLLYLLMTGLRLEGQ